MQPNESTPALTIETPRPELESHVKLMETTRAGFIALVHKAYVSIGLAETVTDKNVDEKANFIKEYAGDLKAPIETKQRIFRLGQEARDLIEKQLKNAAIPTEPAQHSNGKADVPPKAATPVRRTPSRKRSTPSSPSTEPPATTSTAADETVPTGAPSVELKPVADETPVTKVEIEESPTKTVEDESATDTIPSTDTTALTRLPTRGKPPSRPGGAPKPKLELPEKPTRQKPLKIEDDDDEEEDEVPLAIDDTPEPTFDAAAAAEAEKEAESATRLGEEDEDVKALKQELDVTIDLETSADEDEPSETDEEETDDEYEKKEKPKKKLVDIKIATNTSGTLPDENECKKLSAASREGDVFGQKLADAIASEKILRDILLHVIEIADEEKELYGDEEDQKKALLAEFDRVLRSVRELRSQRIDSANIKKKKQAKIHMDAEDGLTTRTYVLVFLKDILDAYTDLEWDTKAETKKNVQKLKNMHGRVSMDIRGSLLNYLGGISKGEEAEKSFEVLVQSRRDDILRSSISNLSELEPALREAAWKALKIAPHSFDPKKGSFQEHAKQEIIKAVQAVKR